MRFGPPNSAAAIDASIPAPTGSQAPNAASGSPGLPWTFAHRDGAPATAVNDVHSKLNRTIVDRTIFVDSVHSLQQIVRAASSAGLQISIAGGRHAMGGQQFGSGTILLDMTGLDRVLELDSERGLVVVEAGIDWPRLVNHLVWAGAGQPDRWGIVQKQTGADRLTIGGALSANIHGRGLCLRPMIGDIESFDLVDHRGELVTCSRTRHRELFMLAIGGYGLFGVIARVTLRLARRHKLERRVTIVRIENLPELFDRRIADGFEYGDCQFATDPESEAFLHAGVFSCYRPVPDDRVIPDDQQSLTHRDWQRLLLLAHVDKSKAFTDYARYYMSTDGQLYWSDTHQLASYIDNYHTTIDRETKAPVEGSEMISELYVRRADLPAFMATVRDDARQSGMNIIYGTVRLIERDDESVLAWAREPWACVVFNLHVDHCREGIDTARRHFQALIDRVSEFGGTYYLTYHRWARRDQVERCHPRMREFLELKRACDPREVFTSDWYRHHVQLMGSPEKEAQR